MNDLTRQERGDAGFSPEILHVTFPPFPELVRTVKQVKPRFSDAVIQQNVRDLASDGLLVASSARVNAAKKFRIEVDANPGGKVEQAET